PDLCIPPPKAGGAGPPNRPERDGKSAGPSPGARGNGRSVASKPARKPVLPADQSAALQDRLLGGVAALSSQEGGGAWAPPAADPTTPQVVPRGWRRRSNIAPPLRRTRRGAVPRWRWRLYAPPRARGAKGRLAKKR